MLLRCILFRDGCGSAVDKQAVAKHDEAPEQRGVKEEGRENSFGGKPPPLVLGDFADSQRNGTLIFASRHPWFYA